MVHEEFIELEIKNNFTSMLSTVEFVKHYSSENMIRKKSTGELFSEAIDYLPFGDEYEETDIPIIIDEPQTYVDILDEMM